MKTTPARPGSADPRQVEALFQRGLQLHVQNQLQAAGQAYAEVLRLQPTHARALHLMGLTALQAGQPQTACGLFDRALALQPSLAEAWDHRGTALHGLGRPGDALASFDKALALNAANAGVQANRAHVLQALGRHDEAVAGYDKATAIAPGFAEAHFARGVSLAALQRSAEAIEAYDRAIALHPGHAKAFHARGMALNALERHGEAVASFDRAIALHPPFAEALDNRSIPLRKLGRLDEALASSRQALALDPSSAAAHTNLGCVETALGRPAEAVSSHDRAIGLDPRLIAAHGNRGNTLSLMRRYEEALAAYGQTVALAPGSAQAHLDLAMCLLRLERFADGWREYEWRIPRDRQLSARAYAQPRWTGREPVEGRTVFIYPEQGLGDTIQFCRYAALLAGRGAEVVMAVQPPLLDLMAGLDPRVTVIADPRTPERFDLHSPMLSLPLAFATDLATIPAPARYLDADAETAARWQAKLGPADKPRVGVAWSGNPLHNNDASRSIPFETFRALLSDRAEWLSLQREVRPAEAAMVRASPLRDFGEALGTFADTAALIAHTDLVVTVDTSVAHLAGAMGKPVWILLPHDADWRWLRDRTDSPWYPSARLFRQDRVRDWTGVLAAVAAALPATPVVG